MVLGEKGIMELNRDWRLFATGYCYSLFGIGGILLSLTVFPIIFFMPVQKAFKQNLAKYIIHISLKFFIAIVQASGVWYFRINGLKKLTPGKGHLFIANHPTLLDIVILISVLPKVTCIVKKGVWDNPVMMASVRSAGYICNNGTEQLLEECINLLKKGENLIVFPEGSRSVEGRPGKFQRGFANIALKSKKNITPIYVSSDDVSLTKSHRWYDIPQTGRNTIRVNIDQDIDITHYLPDDKRVLIQSRKLTTFVEKYYQGKFNAHE